MQCYVQCKTRLKNICRNNCYDEESFISVFAWSAICVKSLACLKKSLDLAAELVTVLYKCIHSFYSWCTICKERIKPLGNTFQVEAIFKMVNLCKDQIDMQCFLNYCLLLSGMSINEAILRFSSSGQWRCTLICKTHR